jgi:hypothetical protein|tara:strand:+ start:3144 stop:3518 length:375 start_codon:yes stop_codon:yes gene_type:complete
MTTMMRHFDLTIKELEKQSNNAYYDYKKNVDNHNKERKNYYPLRMQEWYDIEKDINNSYQTNLKEIKNKIKYYKKNLLEEKIKLEAANTLLKLSKSTKKRKLLASEQPIRKSKRLAEKQLNASH